MMKYGSLFSGIGGGDLGLERAGMTCAWQVENNRACNRVLEHHWPNVRRYGDVTTISGQDLEPVDLIVGGFPCTDLSIAGNRAGLAGEQSGLWREFRRLLEELRPPWYLIENVPGLLSSFSPVEPPPSEVRERCFWDVEETSDLGTILAGLGKLGYGWAYRILDAEYFGLAQRRERVFIVGHLGNGAGPVQVLFEPESLSGNPPPRRQTGERVAGTLKGSSPGSGTDNSAEQTDRLVVSRALRGSHRRSGADDPDYGLTVSHPLLGKSSEDGTGQGVPLVVCTAQTSANGHGIAEDVTHALDGTQGQAVAFDTAQITSRVNRTRVEAGLPASTMNDKGLLSVAFTERGRKQGRMTVRRLTPLECERLQGFPDTYFDGIKPPLSDSAKYRMLGNAMPVPVIAWIGRRIVTVESTGATI